MTKNVNGRAIILLLCKRNNNSGFRLTYIIHVARVQSHRLLSEHAVDDLVPYHPCPVQRVWPVEGVAQLEQFIRSRILVEQVPGQHWVVKANRGCREFITHASDWSHFLVICPQPNALTMSDYHWQPLFVGDFLVDGSIYFLCRWEKFFIGPLGIQIFQLSCDFIVRQLENRVLEDHVGIDIDSNVSGGQTRGICE